MRHLLVFSIALFAACEPAAEVDTAPKASNLQAGGGPFLVGLSSQVTGSLFVEDSDKDLAKLMLAMTRPDGSALGQLEIPVTSNGQVSGQLGFSFELTPDRAGDHQLIAWAVDQAGQESNRVTTSLGVRTADTTPALSDLAVVIGLVPVFAEVTLSGTVAWTDGDQNLTTLAVRVLDVRNQALAEASLPVSGEGPTGTAPLAITFTAREVGSHKLEVTAIDADGKTSRPLTQTFAVTLSPSAPTFRDLDLANAKAYVGIPSPIPVSFAFTDSDGDIDTLHVRVTAADTSLVLERTLALDLSGQTSGTATREVLVTAPSAGRYTLSAWVSDAALQRSDSRSMTFDATVAQTTRPTVSNLQVSAPTLHPNVVATLSGSVDFGDIDANADTLVVRFGRLGGNTLASARLPIDVGTYRGNLTFALPVTPLSLGLHALVVTVEDTDGQSSTELARNLDVTRSATAPVASNLTLPGVRAWVDIATAIPVSLGFSDSDGDLTALRYRVASPSGAVAASGEIELAQSLGLTSGTVSAAVPFTAPLPGRYTFVAQLVDATSQTSDEVSLTFDATAASTTAPKVSSLDVTTLTAVAGKPSTLGGTFRFEDVDANTTTLVLRVIGPGSSAVAESRTQPVQLAGVSGLVPFSLVFTPAQTGYHTLELWVEDAQGQASTRLSRGFSVITSPTAPVVSGLDLGSSRALVNVASTLAGTLTFSDVDQNVTTLHLRVLAPGGAEALSATQNATATSPRAFTQTFTATIEGRHTLEVWLSDQLGETSNRVSRTFDALRTNTTPVVTALTVTAPTLFTNLEARLVGQVAFSDVDGDVRSLLSRVLGPDNGVVHESVLTVGAVASGLTAGQLDLELTFTPSAPGAHRLEVWLQDMNGQSSSKQSRTLTVLDTRPLARNLTVLHEQLFRTRTSTLSGTVELVDHDGDLAELKLQVVRPNNTTWPEVSVALTDMGGVTQAVVPFSLSLTPDVTGTHTLRVSAVDGRGQTSVFATRALTVFDTSNVASACSALGVDCTGQGFCYDVNASTCDYFEDRSLEPPAVCDEVTSTGSQALCVSSTSDPQSPLLTANNRCKFVQFWSNPTSLPIDCRCPEARFDQRCMRPYFTSQATSFGSGPRIRTLANTIQPWRGTVLGREWLLPVRWSTSNRPHETMIFAVNLDTGNRRYFSGAYNDPANGYTAVGQGPAFTQVMDLKVGPDNQLYAVGATSDIAPPRIWRVHPTTGDRTLLFDEATAPESQLCPNFSSLPGRKVVQMTTEGFAMDPQGRFYFSNVGMPGPSILRLTVAGVGGASQTSCSYLTRVMDCPLCTTQDNVGGGWDVVQFDMRAFEIHAGKLFTVTDKRFLSVDLATGHRSLVSFASDVGAIGTGPINAEGLADRWTTWDPHRQVFWTSGVLGGSWSVTVDPTTGNRTAWPCFHPSRGVMQFCEGTGMPLTPGPLNFGGMVIDPLPPHDLFFAHDGFAIVKYEVKTGNAFNFSL